MSSPTIHVQVLSGPDAGVQKALTDPRITFGRAAENTIGLGDPAASRQHGEFRFEAGDWYVVNASTNGTTVNGRKIKTGRPHKLKPGDVIGVDKTKLMIVQFTPETVAPVAGGDAAPAAEAKPKVSSRAKLWIGIGGYMAAMLLVFFVMASLGGKGSAGASAAPPLADADIAREIHQIAKVERPDERDAAEALRHAQELYLRINNKADVLFEAHQNFKKSLAFSGKHAFDGLDQLHYDEVETRLTDLITRDYKDAYAKLRNHQWVDAEAALRKLLQEYPDSSSQVFGNVKKQLIYVIANLPKRKSF
jgi:hypothetical protein